MFSSIKQQQQQQNDNNLQQIDSNITNGSNNGYQGNNLYDAYQIQTKFRQSMPDLQNIQVRFFFLMFKKI